MTLDQEKWQLNRHEYIVTTEQGRLLCKKIYRILHESTIDAQKIGQNLSWEYLEECLQKDIAIIVRDQEDLRKIKNGQMRHLKKCKWSRLTDGDDMWQSACGQEFMLIEDTTPTECEFRYCPFCGKELKETTNDT